MSGLIGKKIGMTSVYSAEGKNIPCTVIEAGPCVVTQIKTVEKDTYEAVQIAYDETSEKHATSSLLGHFKKAGTTPKRKLAEFKDMPEVNLGDTLTVELFSEEDWVDVTGISKGKGFQGVVKRHGFGGVGGQTHVSLTGYKIRLMLPDCLPERWTDVIRSIELWVSQEPAPLTGDVSMGLHIAASETALNVTLVRRTDADVAADAEDA